MATSSFNRTTPDGRGPFASRRWRILGTAGVAALLLGGGIGVAAAGQNSGQSAGTAAAPTVNCPSVADKLPANIPASAQAEILRNLALLNTQISEANNRLRTSVGQGGANFIQNAILGPLEDKRIATLNRMETAIGRAAPKPEGLEAFAACTLGATGPAEPSQLPAGNGNSGNNGGAAAAVPTVNCPALDPARLGNVPASAQAEIDRNIALLQTQINEANNRLRTSVGQGGANFIQNAILGPLEDKRVATFNRMETAVGRQGVRPEGLEQLAPCTLNTAGDDDADEEAPAAPPALESPAPPANNPNPGNNGGAAPTVNCPALDRARLGNVPASAQAEVDSNIALLQTQINEANNRLRNTVGQGGANFIQNAILGPLEDKRFATLNRIETAIGRNGVRPEGLEQIAACTLNN